MIPVDLGSDGMELAQQLFLNFIEPCKNLTGASDLDVVSLLKFDGSERTKAAKCCLNCLLKQTSIVRKSRGELLSARDSN